jgi:hypothetical protein
MAPSVSNLAQRPKRQTGTNGGNRESREEKGVMLSALRRKHDGSSTWHRRMLSKYRKHGTQRMAGVGFLRMQQAARVSVRAGMVGQTRRPGSGSFVGARAEAPL